MAGSRANRLVQHVDQVKQNILTLETARGSSDPETRNAALELIKRGTCFVAYTGSLGLSFAPSKFIGYKNNKVLEHSQLRQKRDGRDTNVALKALFGGDAVVNPEAESAYQQYALKLGISPNKAGSFGKPRRFWKLPEPSLSKPPASVARRPLTDKRAVTQESLTDKLESDVQQSLKDSEEARNARLAKARRKPRKVTVAATVFDRNPDVIAAVLLRANGSCEECESPAPFKRASDGSPYLEVHHRVPLSQNGEDTVQNAVALCPNCHRRMHFGVSI